MSFLGGVVDYWKEADAYAFKERDRIDSKVTQLIPLLRKDKETSTLKQQKAEEALSWWESKFSDYEGSDEKRKAVLNLVSQNPFKALKVAEQIQKIENVTGQTNIKGNLLLEYYDILDQTKPADLSQEEWIKKSSELITEPAIKNVDDIIVRLLNPNLSAKEFNEIYADYQPTTLPADPFIQTNYSAIMEMPIEDIEKSMGALVSQSENRLINAMAKRRRQIEDAKDKGEPFDTIQTELNRLNQMKNQIDDDQYSEDFFKEFATEAFKAAVESQDALARIPSFMMNFPFLYIREDGTVPVVGDEDYDNWIKNF